MNQRFKELLFSVDKNATSLAKELNVSKTAVLRILSGENQPSSKVLIPLGEILNVNINWLLFGVG
jgi:transcriptional regulator with XRE-family HTH domain